MRRRRTATRKRRTDREKGPEDPPGELMRAPLEGSSAGLAMFQSGRCAAGRRSRAAIVRPRTSSSSSNLQQRLHVSTRDEMRSTRGKERERDRDRTRTQLFCSRHRLRNFGHSKSYEPGTVTFKLRSRVFSRNFIGRSPMDDYEWSRVARENNCTR